jgi:hypothetical protein
MPVMSYLVYPVKGAKQKLLEELTAMEYCEPVAALNEEILILVTDTPDENQEKSLMDRIRQLKSLQSLNMTSGFTDQE